MVGWINWEGCIVYPIEESMSDMGYADNKATKLLDNLEKCFGLIERKRQGLGKPNLIYVKNFVTGVTGPPEERFKNLENHDSAVVKTMILESSESRCNNTDINNTDYNNIDSYPSGNTEITDESRKADRMDTMDLRSQYKEYFDQSLELAIYRQNHPFNENVHLLNAVDERDLSPLWKMMKPSITRN